MRRLLVALLAACLATVAAAGQAAILATEAQDHRPVEFVRPLLTEASDARSEATMVMAEYDLAASFPFEIGGQRRASLLVQSGWETPFQDRRVRVDNDQLETDALLTTGTSPDALARASGWWPGDSGRPANVSAFQVAGAGPEVMRQVYHEVLLPRMGRGSPRQEASQVAGREVTLLWDDAASRPVDPATPLHLYFSGDTIWFVDAEQPLLAGIVSALPPAPPRPVPAYDLAATFPEEFGGVRRTHLSVKSGWGMPLATGTPIDLDQITSEILARTGAGPDDLASASGLSMEVGFGTTLAAYQVGAADPGATREVLEEVLVPRLGDRQTRHEIVKVDGREVFRLHTGLASSEPSYLFVNGDTIWWLDAPESFLVDLFDQLP